MAKKQFFTLFIFLGVFIGLVTCAFAAESPEKKVKITPSYSAVAIPANSTVDVVIQLKIQTPEIEKVVKRPPVSLSLVMDKSGSMDENKKMDYAIRAAKTLVQNLSDKDMFSLVVYDEKTKVLYPLSNVSDKTKLNKIIEGITPDGYTFLSGGLELGIKQLASVKSEGPTRVLLMSDGLANHGVTDAEQVAAIGAQARKQGITVSTIGLGLDFNEDLMQLLAQRSGGQYYYIKDSESLPSVVQQELNQVVNNFTKNIHARFVPAGYVQDVKVYGYTSAPSAKDTRIEMSDLSSGEERQVMLRLKVKPEAKLGVQNLGSFVLEYTANDEKYEEVIPVAVEVVSDKAASDAANTKAGKEIVVVQEEAQLLEAEEAQLVAVQELQKGNTAKAKEILDTQKRALAPASPNNVAIANKIEELELLDKKLDEASRDMSMQKDIAKKSKASAYISSKGSKQGIMLQNGDKGYAVERLQKALKAKGYYKGNIDGVYSDKVTEAVKECQKANKLTVNGIAGPATMSALGL